MIEDKPYLYILMRGDLDSLTPGKACAQAAHAANHCVTKVTRLSDPSKEFHNEVIGKVLQAWQEETKQGFGTTIVLKSSPLATKKIFTKISNKYLNFTTVAFGLTHDPTYPVSDGKITHLIPVDTCGWILGFKSVVAPFVEELNLY